MEVGIKGKGSNIKWIDETELPIYKKLQDERASLINYFKEELQKVKLENIEIVKKVISR